MTVKVSKCLYYLFTHTHDTGNLHLLIRGIGSAYLTRVEELAVYLRPRAGRGGGDELTLAGQQVLQLDACGEALGFRTYTHTRSSGNACTTMLRLCLVLLQLDACGEGFGFRSCNTYAALSLHAKQCCLHLCLVPIQLDAKCTIWCW